jgi:branched-chain amino acid transport system permease protein
VSERRLPGLLANASRSRVRLVRTLTARQSWIASGGIAALLLVPPLSAMYGNLGMIRWEEVLSVAMLAIGMNIVTGYAGQLTLGPGAVFAVSAYTAAIVVAHEPAFANLGLLCLVGVGAALIVSLVTGAPALRVGSFYLALVTLFFAEIVPVVATNTSALGGEGGEEFFAGPSFVPSWLAGVGLYEITVVIALAMVLLQYLIRQSQVGRRFLCLKTSEELASTVGVSPYRTKLLAFLVSAVPAGLAGAFYLASQQFISPDSISLTLSINVLEAIVLGGLAATWGPLVGTVLVVGLTPVLGPLQEYAGIVTGGVLLAIVLFAPDGLAGSSMIKRALGTAGVRGGKANVHSVLTPHQDVPQGPGEQPMSSAPSYRRPSAAVGPENVLSRGTTRPISRESAVSADNSALLLENLTRSFGGVLAVDHVNLTVQAGEIHGLVGSNGSGKTTLLNLVCGFSRVETGQISLGALRLDHLPPSRIARAGIGRTFQAPKLIVKATLLENVLLAAEQVTGARDMSAVLRLPAGRAAHKDASEVARAMLDVVGLGARAEMIAEEASHGILRLVEVARCLARRPRFVLLDEPAAGLSVDETEVLQNVLTQVAESGTGLLLVEHNVPFVMGLANRITVLDQGHIIAHGSREDVESDPRVREAFLGKGAYALCPARRSSRSRTYGPATERWPS